MLPYKPRVCTLLPYPQYRSPPLCYPDSEKGAAHPSKTRVGLAEGKTVPGLRRYLDWPSGTFLISIFGLAADQGPPG